ncbi:MAG: hypothetical protein ACRC7O_16065 [Fimbriiglobus sp.]
MILLTAVGCSEPTPSVTGKITFRGNPIQLGRVKFISSQGNACDANLREDGSYSIRPAQPGVMKVVVTGGAAPRLPPRPPGKGKGKAGPPAVPPQQVASEALPKEYGKKETTKLSVELKPGPNEFSYDIP